LKQWGQAKQKAPESTPNINNGNILILERIISLLLIKGGMFDCITVDLVILVLCCPKFERIVRLPINKCMMGRIRKGSGVKRVDVSSHSEIGFFGHNSIYFLHLLIVFFLVGLLAMQFLSFHKRNLLLLFNLVNNKGMTLLKLNIVEN
jgi:hypothetical protein